MVISSTIYRKLARQSLVALAVLVVSLMVAGLGLAGGQAYAAEGADAPSITITFKAGDGGTVGPEENLVQTFAANDSSEVAAVTATPSDGYVFVDWTRDGEEVSPEEGDGTIDENVYPEVDFGSSVSPSRLLGMRLMALPTAASGHPTQPGEVKLSKTATPVSGMVNTWDVTVRVEGKDTTKTSDIVLVIDRSGSMKDNNRMVRAKEAAKQFVSTLLPDEHTRIAIVSFAKRASTNQLLTNDANKLNDAIDGLKADGGTFTQAGIRQAESILANSTADVKNIVLLSDGKPTYSYDTRTPAFLQRSSTTTRKQWGRAILCRPVGDRTDGVCGTTTGTTTTATAPSPRRPSRRKLVTPCGPLR